MQVDGWGCATSGDVEWIDANGAVHSGDTWPACLEPVPLTSPSFGEERVVRFAAVKVDVDGMRTRPIVMVDCSG